MESRKTYLTINYDLKSLNKINDWGAYYTRYIVKSKWKILKEINFRKQYSQSYYYNNNLHYNFPYNHVDTITYAISIFRYKFSIYDRKKIF